MVWVGAVASGTSVFRALGVPLGGVAAVPDCVCSEGIEVLDEPSGVLGAAFVQMCSSAGPSAELWRLMEMGIEGLRYFIRGSISRQNFLGPVSRAARGGWLEEMAGGRDVLGEHEVSVCSIVSRKRGVWLGVIRRTLRLYARRKCLC